jgi:hypothetical protein
MSYLGELIVLKQKLVQDRKELIERLAKADIKLETVSREIEALYEDRKALDDEED